MATYVQLIVGNLSAAVQSGLLYYRYVAMMRVEILPPTSSSDFANWRRQQEFRL
jgi:hypothetical protein